MSHPKQLRLFKAWAKAMEEGAIVDKPSYRGTAGATTAPTKSRGRANTRPRRTRRRKRAQKTQD